MKYVADAALEPMYPCEEHVASGTELNNTACQLHEEVLQPDNSSVHCATMQSSSENVSRNVRHGVAKLRYNERGRAWCLRLGMSAGSWDGWAKMHANPSVSMSYFFLSYSLATSAIAYMCTGVRGEGHMYFVVLVPFGCDVVVNSAVLALFWWWGVVIAHHKLYPAVPAFLALCAMPMCYVAFLGSETTVPWNNSFHCISIMCLVSFFMLRAAASGLVPGEHPAEPRTSIMEPIIRASTLTLLFLDAFSDLAVIRSLLVAVCSHCTCVYFRCSAQIG